jgi:hypothetical protein
MNKIIQQDIVTMLQDEDNVKIILDIINSNKEAEQEANSYSEIFQEIENQIHSSSEDIKTLILFNDHTESHIFWEELYEFLQDSYNGDADISKRKIHDYVIFIKEAHINIEIVIKCNRDFKNVHGLSCDNLILNGNYDLNKYKHLVRKDNNDFTIIK